MNFHTVHSIFLTKAILREAKSMRDVSNFLQMNSHEAIRRIKRLAISNIGASQDNGSTQKAIHDNVSKQGALQGNGSESPQQGDLRLSGPSSGQGAGSGARTRDRRVPADLRADSQATVLPTPPDR
ncbi:hypothetical protein PoB_001537800 [Plakobranchus ocellatus]|uniref:Uncharacterized protein n=1 Tax=Plakobranchus ocellatus TaxID=259542 RepID=A0AAV3Z2Q1_9GAST|nr:hypothetical protein PoB_001537800 [Plakobranchus ocellatus]